MSSLTSGCWNCSDSWLVARLRRALCSTCLPVLCYQEWMINCHINESFYRTQCCLRATVPCLVFFGRSGGIISFYELVDNNIIWLSWLNPFICLKRKMLQSRNSICIHHYPLYYFIFFTVSRYTIFAWTIECWIC